MDQMCSGRSGGFALVVSSSVWRSFESSVRMLPSLVVSNLYILMVDYLI